MQIVVNTRLLINDKLDGIGWFTAQTLKRITQKNPDTHFVFLFDRDFDDQFIFSDNITPIVIGPQARHPFLYYSWFHVSVKNLLNRLNPDLFLSPDGFLAFGAKCKQLPVIHDINFFHNPKDLKFLTSKYCNYFFPKYSRLATRIATVSEFSKADIAKNYHVSASKIDVVYNGINEGFKPLSVNENDTTRAKYSAGKSYFLFVGSQSPRKNLGRLILAFDKFKLFTKSDFKLVLVGMVYTSNGEIARTINQSTYKKDILFTGRISQDELEKIMAASFTLAYVPYFEGFGIPLLEAMQCDIPIICSNTTSMPEIAGNAALLVNPFDVDSIAKGMVDLYEQTQLRDDLINAGRARKMDFSWDKTADLLWQSITNCL